jgi:uncharacterized iron-regulated membrane protein
MRKRLRAILFWLHLGSGVAAGLIVLVMSATGVVMTFQPQLLDWAERGSRQVVPRGRAALGVEQIMARAREVQGGAAPTALTLYADRTSAVRVATGRDTGVHVDPYTGEVRELAGAGWRRLFVLMIEWHRWLALDGEQRAVGKAITGVCNAAFLVLALTGLYLWWPRKWSLRAMRLSLWFRRDLASRVRDWNWHNTIGFWTLPVLIVVTSSGMMISYRWVSNLIYLAMGEPSPAAPGPGGAGPGRAAPRAERAPSRPERTQPPPSAPSPGTRALDLDGLHAALTRELPGWTSATWRAGRGGGQSLALSVKSADVGPPFASVQLTLDATTGRVLQRDAYAGYTPARKVRTWLRFLHTGEALGWVGQLVAGLASLGATVLVWTGLSLAIRRLWRWRRSRSGVPLPEAEPLNQ